MLEARQLKASLSSCLKTKTESQTQTMIETIVPMLTLDSFTRETPDFKITTKFGGGDSMEIPSPEEPFEDIKKLFTEFKSLDVKMPEKSTSYRAIPKSQY